MVSIVIPLIQLRSWMVLISKSLSVMRCTWWSVILGHFHHHHVISSQGPKYGLIRAYSGPMTTYDTPYHVMILGYPGWWVPMVLPTNPIWSYFAIPDRSAY